MVYRLHYICTVISSCADIKHLLYILYPAHHSTPLLQHPSLSTSYRNPMILNPAPSPPPLPPSAPPCASSFTPIRPLHVPSSCAIVHHPGTSIVMCGKRLAFWSKLLFRLMPFQPARPTWQGLTSQARVMVRRVKERKWGRAFWLAGVSSRDL